MLKIAFFPAHPAQFWMMKALYDNAPDGIEIIWFARDKDVLTNLLDEFGFEYILLSQAGTGIIKNAIELVSNTAKCLYYQRKYKIDIWLTKYSAGNIAAWLYGKRNISFNDDDEDVVPFIAYSSYPFANKVLVTNWTRMQRFKKKAVYYPSFHELFYLHPNRFCLNHTLLNKYCHTKKRGFAFIRLSSLQAHHDLNVKGLSDSQLLEIIELLEKKFNLDIVISSEKKLSNNSLSKFCYFFPTSDVHHILASARLLIGDSQTMAAEAALSGTPAIVISSLVNRLGYINQLQSKQLIYGLKPENSKQIPQLVYQVMSQDINIHKEKLDSLLCEVTDPVPFFWQEIIN